MQVPFPISEFRLATGVGGATIGQLDTTAERRFSLPTDPASAVSARIC